MLRYKDWMTYSYNNVVGARKKHKHDVFKLHVREDINIQSFSYAEALLNNALKIHDRFKMPQDVLLSGGIDSELIVRVNQKLSIPQNLFTFRLENDLNKQDVIWSQQLANELGLKLNVIDFNVKKFIETDAYDLYQKTLMPIVYLLRTQWFDYLDNLPVVGNCEHYWKRGLGTDYTSKSTWYYKLVDCEFCHSFYGEMTGRDIIGEWYLYTPEPMYSYNKHHVIANLLKDQVPGKASSWSSRHLVVKDLFPSLEYKKKLTGYEGDREPGHKPDYMIDFENKTAGYRDYYSVAIPDYQFDDFMLGKDPIIENITFNDNFIS